MKSCDLSHVSGIQLSLHKHPNLEQHETVVKECGRRLALCWVAWLCYRLGYSLYGVLVECAGNIEAVEPLHGSDSRLHTLSWAQDWHSRVCGGEVAIPLQPCLGDTTETEQRSIKGQPVTVSCESEYRFMDHEPKHKNRWSMLRMSLVTRCLSAAIILIYVISRPKRAFWIVSP